MNLMGIVKQKKNPEPKIALAPSAGGEPAFVQRPTAVLLIIPKHFDINHTKSSCNNIFLKGMLLFAVDLIRAQ